jgi:hypothetical protein
LLERTAATRVPEPAPRPRVLVSYLFSPHTTARFLEQGLREVADVVTCGPTIDPERLSGARLSLRTLLRPQDIPTSAGEEIGSVLRRLPRGWTPDYFLWIETGSPEGPPGGVDRLGLPSACYLIDVHIHREPRLRWARPFDVVFLAHRAQLGWFRERGERAHWLPVGCDGGLAACAREGASEQRDVVFVGAVSRLHVRRRHLLDRLARRFDVMVAELYLEEMVHALGRGRVALNVSLRGDLNMRVFESLSAGACLVTDEAPGSGLGELFRDGRDLAVYRADEELEPLIERLLGDPVARGALADSGRAEALRRHTYRHRALQLLRVLNAQR